MQLKLTVWSIILLSLVFVSCNSDKNLKYDQYVIAGQSLYNTHCSNCHGENGQGLKNLYPPLSNSDYLNNKSKVICIIKNGAKGPMVVNGKLYNQVMLHNPNLYDLDIAQITTYIYSKWGKENTEITTSDSVKLVVCTNSGL